MTGVPTPIVCSMQSTEARGTDHLIFLKRPLVGPFFFLGAKDTLFALNAFLW